MKKCMMALALVALVAGCRTPTTIVYPGSQLPPTTGIGNADVKSAASKMLQSLYRSGRLDRDDGQMYVMTVGKVKNDTTQRLDTDVLTSYITQELMSSGKLVVTSAMAASADNRDEMIDAARSVRNDPEFNQGTVPQLGQKVAPTHSIYGKIWGQELPMDNGDKQIEYYFQLRIVDVKTGLQWWQNQTEIIKITDWTTPTW